MSENAFWVFAIIVCLSAPLVVLPLTTAAGGWNRIYQGESMDILNPSSMVQSGDGGFAIVSLCTARRVDNVGYQGHFTSFDEIQILKTDANGEAQWKQAFTKIDDPAGRTPTVFAGEETYVIVETVDNGYAIASTGYGTFWLFKVDSQGKVLWSRIYTLSDEESGSAKLGSMVLTNDGGFALAGSVQTPDGSSDFWLVKVKSNGDAQWNQTYNSGTYKDSSGNEFPRDDAAWCLIQTRDGGYALAGTASLFRSSTSSIVYPSWMVKTDSTGRQIWNKGYDAPNVPFGKYQIVQTDDSGYVIAGNENQNIYLLKTDSAGIPQWSKTCDTNYTGTVNGLVLLNDQGLTIAGTWNDDFGLLRMDSSGNSVWVKTYNARENASTSLRSNDISSCMIRTSDGAYAIAGSTMSSYEIHQDIFLVKTETLEQPPESFSPSQTPATTTSQPSDQSSLPTFTISPNSTMLLTPTLTPTSTALLPTPSPTVPEFPSLILAFALMTASIVGAALYRNKIGKKTS